MKKMKGYFVRTSGFKVKKKGKKKKVCNVAKNADPSDDICDDFAAQVSAQISSNDSEEICTDFAAQVDGSLDSDEVCSDFAAQMHIAGSTSEGIQPDVAAHVVVHSCPHDDLDPDFAAQNLDPDFAAQMVGVSSCPSEEDFAEQIVDFDSGSDDICNDFAVQMAVLDESPDDICADFAAQMMAAEAAMEISDGEPVVQTALGETAASPALDAVHYGPHEADAAIVDTVHYGPHRSLTTIQDVVDADIWPR